MIKYYKLALTILLVSCFLSNTMETTQEYIKKKTVVILSNPNFLLKDLASLDGINLLPYAKIALSLRNKIQKKIKEVIGDKKFLNSLGIDELGYLRMNISNEQEKQLLKIEEVARIVSFGDLDIDKLLECRKNGKNPASCDIIKKDSGQPMRTESENKKEKMAVVLSNPNSLYLGLRTIRPYLAIAPNSTNSLASFKLKRIMMEKIKQAIGVENPDFKPYDRKGYFTVKISGNQKSTLLNIEGIANIGPYKDLNFKKLDTCRNEGDTTLDGIFQDKEKK